MITNPKAHCKNGAVSITSSRDTNWIHAQPKPAPQSGTCSMQEARAWTVAQPVCDLIPAGL